jgi:uncharacterized protein YndB with AHSA1/START domain
VTSDDRAQVTFPTDTHMLIKYELDAPKDLVWKAWFTPELIKRWLGDRGEVTIDDLRVGGRWRYVIAGEGGYKLAAHGEYQEVVPNERVVSTEIYESIPRALSMNTVTWTEEDGRTTLTILVEHTSQEHRDAHINAVKVGMQETLERLEQVAISLR